MAEQNITIYFTDDEFKKLENAAEKELRDPSNFAKYYTLEAVTRINDQYDNDEDTVDTEEDFEEDEEDEG